LPGPADPYQFQPKVKLSYTFPHKTWYRPSKINIKNYDTYNADEKYKTMWTGTGVNKAQFFIFKFSQMCKTCGKIRTRIGIKTTPTHSTEVYHTTQYKTESKEIPEASPKILKGFQI
jgi:hypothetical protein